MMTFLNDHFWALWWLVVILALILEEIVGHIVNRDK